MLLQVAGYIVTMCGNTFIQSDVAHMVALNYHIYLLTSTALIINEHVACVVCICLFLLYLTTCGV